MTFYSSARDSDNLVRPIKISGDEANDSETSQESAAREGIRYIEIWESLEIEDLHYDELGYVRHVQINLHYKL